MHFATALEQTVNVVVYDEFEAVLEIDKGRNIIYNYWWRPTIISRLLARDPLMCHYEVVARDSTRSLLNVPVFFRVQHTWRRPARRTLGRHVHWLSLPSQAYFYHITLHYKSTTTVSKYLELFTFLTLHRTFLTILPLVRTYIPSI